MSWKRTRCIIQSRRHQSTTKRTLKREESGEFYQLWIITILPRNNFKHCKKTEMRVRIRKIFLFDFSERTFLFSEHCKRSDYTSRRKLSQNGWTASCSRQRWRLAMSYYQPLPCHCHCHTFHHWPLFSSPYSSPHPDPYHYTPGGRPVHGIDSPLHFNHYYHLPSSHCPHPHHPHPHYPHPPHDLQVDDLFTDLADGRKLLRLLEIISGEKLGKPNSGKMRVHRYNKKIIQTALTKVLGLSWKYENLLCRCLPFLNIFLAAQLVVPTAINICHNVEELLKWKIQTSGNSTI